MAWQFGPDVEVVLRDAEVEATTASMRIAVSLPPALRWRRLHGSTEPIGGWYSDTFGRKVPSVSLVGVGPARSSFETRIRVSYR
jgi:hypothetical protein